MIREKVRNDTRLLKYKVIEQLFYKPQSRKDLIDYFKIRPNTISVIINKLKEENRITEDTVIQTGGRPLVRFRLNSHYKYYGGIMIEGERIQGTVIGYDGAAIHSCLVKNRQDITGEEFISNLKSIIRDLIVHTPDGRLEKIQICGNYFSSDRKYFSSGYLEHERPIEVLPKLQEEFTVEFFTGSGMEAMITAEKMIGGNTGDFLYVHFGSGIIVGFVDGGLMVKKGQTKLGELGHTRTFSNKKCRCGRIGCLETVASVWAIKEYLKNNPQLITRDQWIHLDNLPISDILRIYLDLCLVKKDEQVINHLRSMARALGIAIRNTLDLVVRQQVILSGSMLEAADIIVPEIEKEISKPLYPFEIQPIPVKVSKLDLYAPSHGAALFLLAEEVLNV